MRLSEVRAAYCRRIVAAAKTDSRLVGVLDCGATSQGRGGEWSDLDLALFIRDESLSEFQAEWQSWAGTVGPSLLAIHTGD